MLSGGADGVILGSVPASRTAADLETMAELADRGVAQLLVADSAPPDGVDVLAPEAGTTADVLAEPAVAERAVAQLVGRLMARRPAAVLVSATAGPFAGWCSGGLAAEHGNEVVGLREVAGHLGALECRLFQNFR
jgi:hypothetical protein